MFKKVLSTVLLIVMVFAVSLPCSAAVVTDGEKFYVLGDANGDGTMDIRDLVRVKRYIADNSVEIVNVAADIDGDGKVNANDLTCYVKGFLNSDEPFTTGGNYWSEIY